LYFGRLSGEFRNPALYFLPDSLSKTEISSGLGICCRISPIAASDLAEPSVFSASMVYKNDCSSVFLSDPQAARIKATIINFTIFIGSKF
jgi:hypothetical protein